MFFTRHSLGFALLTFLISLACAMPTLERRGSQDYRVTMLGERGQLVWLAEGLERDVKNSINAILEKMGEPIRELRVPSPGTFQYVPPAPDKLYYFKLEKMELEFFSRKVIAGKDNFCADNPGYGYFVNPKGQNPRILLGGVVVSDKDGLRVVHLPSFDSLNPGDEEQKKSLELWKEADSKFLRVISGWKEMTLEMAEAFRKAAANLPEPASPNPASQDTGAVSTGPKHGGKREREHSLEVEEVEHVAQGEHPTESKAFGALPIRPAKKPKKELKKE
ncbi:hypothetical protein BDP27DRAFT_1430296 [Rhodocollybia butyracea]|uniref:Uncharacterized protein n=1 Tax=Rhodocollybia butyracea TaxID=206335 RepID=A0A9P5P8K4_9AGAR|nr:hypothetical protein BDP27DRAFT_1430296 [Rhodocollybia butyracea]